MATFELRFVCIFIINILFQRILSEECKCGRETDLATRVVGGGLSGELGHPFLAAVMMENIFICGGSVISPTFVVTAGHCVTENIRQHFSVAVGVHNRVKWSDMFGNIYTVKEVIRHRKYEKVRDGFLINDIALLRTSTRIRFNNKVQPICLPQNNDISEGQAAKLVGWGIVKENLHYPTMTPRQTLLTVLTYQQFKMSPLYDMLMDAGIKNVQKKMIFGYRADIDACMGDSGGPLFTMEDSEATPSVYHLIGLVSMGVGCGNEKGMPGIYTAVGNYVSWIKSYVSDLCSP